MLMADDLMRNNLDNDELKFLARALDLHLRESQKKFAGFDLDLISVPTRSTDTLRPQLNRSLTREQGPRPLSKHQRHSLAVRFLRGI